MNKLKINYLVDLKNILKSGKSSYQEFTKENKQLKQYTTNAKTTTISTVKNIH